MIKYLSDFFLLQINVSGHLTRALGTAGLTDHIPKFKHKTPGYSNTRDYAIYSAQVFPLTLRNIFLDQGKSHALTFLTTKNCYHTPWVWKKKTQLAKETKWKRQNTYDTNVITSIRSIWQSEDMVKELMFIIYILKIEDLAVLLTI